MSDVQESNGRYEIQDTGSSLKVSISSRNNSSFLIGVWLIGWIIAAKFAGGALVAGDVGLCGGLFLLAWLLLWTVGGIFFLKVFVWKVAGRDNVEVSHDSIKIQRAVSGNEKVEEYIASQIKNLRVAPPGPQKDTYVLDTSNAEDIYDGFLKFDYRGQTISFGGGIDEAEAEQILEKIVVRFPQYRFRK